MLSIRATAILEGEDQLGTVVGKWFIGYVNRSGEGDKKTTTFYLMIHRNAHAELKKQIDTKRFNTDSDAGKKPVKVKVWHRSGNKWWSDYKPTTVDWSHLDMRPNQTPVIERIKELYQKSRSRSLAVYVYGHPGTGKTSIGYLLAKEFKSHYFDGWKPVTEGNRFADAHSSINPDKEDPLIVGVNEIDTYIDKLDKMKPAKDVEREIEGKADWNNFFDAFNMGRYQNTIIVATGNVPIEEINRADSSLMRPGRFDLVVEVGLTADPAEPKPKDD